MSFSIRVGEVVGLAGGGGSGKVEVKIAMEHHPNDAGAWACFLARVPPRERLEAMGREAAATALPSWDDVAERYLGICEEALGAEARR